MDRSDLWELGQPGAYAAEASADLSHDPKSGGRTTWMRRSVPAVPPRRRAMCWRLPHWDPTPPLVTAATPRNTALDKNC